MERAAGLEVRPSHGQTAAVTAEEDPLGGFDMKPALREGLDQLDTAEGLAQTIQRVSDEIAAGLARIHEMRGYLPSKYHSTFSAMVERGYMPMIESKRTAIKQYKRQMEQLRRDAAKQADG